MDRKIERQDLNGKRVVILGGSKGIGFSTAKTAAEEGANIVIVSGNRQRIDEALAQLPSGAEGHVVDLSREENIREFFAGLGTFDHLVYTAGENLRLYNLGETDLREAANFFGVRYWGAFAAVKYAAPFIRPGGSIGLTGGIAGARPGKGWAVASSICSAMEGLCRALAVELAPVRVNLVAPGIIRTNLWDAMPEADRDSLFENTGRSLLVGRIGEPEDIAASFVYLMKQQFATGQNLIVDGGAVLQ